MSQVDEQRLSKLNDAFSPSAPINQEDLFAGRRIQLTDVFNAIVTKGQHAILFGERGVGKTSLSKVLSKSHVIVNGASVIVASINCDATIDFSGLWKRLFQQITLTTNKQNIGFNSDTSASIESLNLHLPVEVTPDDIRSILKQLGKTLFIIDELDRLEDKKITTLLADTIKTLSDHAIDATLLLVGVSDSVETLISEHQSIERALVQVRMPRMELPELHEIIDKGLKQADMTIDAEAAKRIVKLSQGLPHYTHLLAQNAAQRAVYTGRSNVEITDVKTAIDNALTKAHQTTISAHNKATISPRSNMYPQVLLACALAKTDPLGFFAAVDVRDPLSLIMNRRYEIPAFSQHLNSFCENSRGPILQRTGTARRYRFRFMNPLMQPFVIMDGLRKGYITESYI